MVNLIELFGIFKTGFTEDLLQLYFGGLYHNSGRKESESVGKRIRVLRWKVPNIHQNSFTYSKKWVKTQMDYIFPFLVH